MPERITHIPFPGSSGQTPTGAMQFENDWPGLFVRGDKAIDMHRCIRHLRQRLASNKDPDVVLSLIVLGELADIVEKDVMIRGDERV